MRQRIIYVAILLLSSACSAQQSGNTIALAFSDSGSAIYTSIQNHGVFWSGNGGRSWIVMNKGLENYMFVYLLASMRRDSSHIIGAAATYASPERREELIEMTSGNEEWTTVPAPEETDGYVSLKSIQTNGGELYMTNGKHLWREELRTRIWQQLPAPDTCATALIGLSTSETGMIYMSTEYVNDNSYYVGRLHLTRDDGQHWSLLLDSLVPPPHKLLVDPNDENHIIVFTKVILESTNAGRSWMTFPLPAGQSSVTIGDFHWCGNQCYAAGRYDSVWTTSDNGLTWRKGNLCDGYYISDIVADPGNPCHAFVLRTDGLYETRDCGESYTLNTISTPVEQPPVADDGSLQITALYPNPFPSSGASSGTLTCLLQGDAVESMNVFVTDALGRVLHSVVTSIPITRKRQIDISMKWLYSGVYFVTAISANKRTVRNLIVNK